jgi:hypothetical protein
MDGGPVENITWRNIRMSFIDWVHETQSGAAFHFIINERKGKTPVRNCLIENVSSNFLYRSQFAGLEGAPLDGVIMRNIQVVVDQPKRDSCYLFEANENVALKIENLQIDWKNNREKWAGISSGSGIVIANQ